MTADRSPFDAWPWRTLAVAVLLAGGVLMWHPHRPPVAEAPVPPPTSAEISAAARRLVATPVGQALEIRFPGASREIAEAQLRDGAAAGRAAAWRLRQVALVTASDPLLDQHASLMRVALAAALDASPSWCSSLLDGTLDTATVMPSEWRRADETFAVLLLSAPPRRDRPLRPGAAYRSLLPAMAALTPEQQRLLGDPRAGRARCEAWRTWYDTVARLPTTPRRLALRAALQR